MKRLLLAIMIIATLSGFTCSKTLDVEHQWITLDFTNMGTGVSTLHYVQLDGPGDYHFSSSESLIQEHRLRVGSYNIFWTLTVTVNSSCTVFFGDDLGNQESLPESGTHTAEFPGVELGNLYSGSTQCR